MEDINSKCQYKMNLEKFLFLVYRRLVYCKIPRIQDTLPLVILSGILIIQIAVFLPVNGYVVVIIGLSIDIVGGIFVISPLINQYSKYQSISWRKNIEKKHNATNTSDWIEGSYVWQDQNKGRLGLVVIGLGFIIQIIGNYFEYLGYR